MKVKIGYHYFESVQNLDPARIDTIYQSNLIENIFSRIVEYDNSGQLLCTLCKKMWVEKETIYFEFKDNLQTIDGFKISAEDAEKSLKRIIALDSNTHGNLRNFIEVDANGNTDSISSTENLLKIETRKSAYPQFVLPLLASMDFSVVPYHATQDNKYHIDFRNTSGPYYVEKDDSKGNILLRANPFHPLYNEYMPQEIQLVSLEYETGVDAFLSEKVDVLDTTYYSYASEFEKLFAQKSVKFNASQTIPLGIALVVFSSSAIKKYSQAERFYFARTIGDAFIKLKRYQWGMKPAFEFFQSNGAGHLSDSQIKEIKLLRDLKPEKNNNKIQFGVWEKAFDSYKTVLADHPEIQVESFKENPSFIEPSKRPEAYVFLTDSSFNEDISLLSYSFSTERLSLSKIDANKWLAEYFLIEQKAKRIEKLRDFQMDLLKSPAIYPIGSMPYFAISREDIELNFPKLFAGSPWWMIRRK